MKYVSLFAVLLLPFIGFSQTFDPVQWDTLKSNGQLGNTTGHVGSSRSAQPAPMPYRISNPAPVQPALTTCACWQERDSSWNVVPITIGSPPDYRNDDGSTGLIAIPFTFCLYGQQWTNCYINNNGNISFGAPYGTFTATGFPNASFVMVAPFWADVDTRNLASGLPWYKVTPTALIVQWDSVGYYGNHADLLNSFQIIITNGSDPLVPGGNVSFCYRDMQWTTGDASSGSGGFGGSDAVVGANAGDGVNYIQFGAFNQPGGTYNGPQGPNSGIDWLDYQSFIFDACANSNNIPPTVSGISVCDTLTLCEGDTLPLNITFFSPEAAQTTTVSVDTTGTTGYVEISNTSGNTASLVAYFLGTSANNGYNNLLITATDNGTPAGVTTIPIVVLVLPAPQLTVSNDTTICPGGSANLNATGATVYTWTPSSSLNNANIPNPVATPAITTTYIVTGSNTACDAKDTIVVNIQVPQANAGQDVAICSGESTQLNGSGGVTYSWSPSTGLSNPSIANPVASPTVTTSYTLTITDALGCTSVDIVNITVNPTPTAAFTYSPSIIFIDSTYFFVDQSTGGVTNWLWTFGDGDSSFTQNTAHTYTTAGSFVVCLITTTPDNCGDTVCATVEVQPHAVEVPNVFTPNGDNTNDMLVFKNLEFFPNSHLVVYDRWGVLVYESDNYHNDWNGKRMGNGGDCTDGTYYFILSGPNMAEPVTGFVTLIR